MKAETNRQAVLSEAEAKHWQRIICFLQEAETVVHFLLRRAHCKQTGKDLSEPTAFAVQADADGELTDKMIVEQLEAIARQARAGFVEGDGFPVFVPMEDYLRQLERQLKSKEVQE